MATGRSRLGLALLPLLVGGCPLSDDYFIDPPRDGSAGSSSGPNPAAPEPGAEAGTGVGAAPSAGAGSEEASSGNGPEMSGGQGPVVGPGPGEAGAPAVTCSPSTERCNGYDDDCDDVIDEQACNSMPAGTVGCSGFVVNDRPYHGYMLCTGMTRDYARAQEACRAQGMRLAWLESEAENRAVSAKVNAIVAGLEAWIGASDWAVEGSWSWDGQGGTPIWLGGELGAPVGDAFVAWGEKTPNNSLETTPQGEDCAVLLAASATWGDRACMIKYAYLCEDPEP